jgi:hypothetical protein
VLTTCYTLIDGLCRTASLFVWKWFFRCSIVFFNNYQCMAIWRTQSIVLAHMILSLNEFILFSYMIPNPRCLNRQLQSFYWHPMYLVPFLQDYSVWECCNFFVLCFFLKYVYFKKNIKLIYFYSVFFFYDSKTVI